MASHTLLLAVFMAGASAAPFPLVPDETLQSARRDTTDSATLKALGIDSSAPDPALFKNFADLEQRLMDANGVSDHDKTGGGIGHSQAQYYLNLVTNRHPKTICETGFFMGVSTAAWLSASENTTVHSFDLQFRKQSTDLLDKQFPNRLVQHMGDTGATIPAFKDDVKCDLLIVDGSHEEEPAFKDIANFKKNSHADSLLVADDTFDCDSLTEHCEECSSCDCAAKPFCNACSRAWKKAVADNVITQIACVPAYWKDKQEQRDYPTGYCFGKYNH